MIGDLSALLAKYDVAVPRYTSYPAVPHWRDVPDAQTWLAALDDAITPPSSSLAVYVHLPFCETLCTFCGCNTVITRNHDRSEPYVDVVLAELDIYRQGVGRLRERAVSQLHLGGGTPTFLPPAALQKLLSGLSERLPNRSAEYEGSVEVDPRVTTAEHLETMRSHGLTRISLGVQDFDSEVLRMVNRPQPLELTSRLCETARAAGYESINFDLIYGLPAQTPATMARLADQVIELRPDRLAAYSFARVPWIKSAQRKFKDEDVPAAEAKRALYEVLRGRLLAAGYEEIGMDHFALPHDSLARAARQGTLHRNFMGYTDRRTTALLGLGVSAISETPSCYHQNEKVITVYERRVAAGEIPTLRGHLLSSDDRHRADRIRTLMTRGSVAVAPGDFTGAEHALAELIADGIVDVSINELTVTPESKPFLRNVASLFDAYLRQPAHDGPTYSKAI
ncbi:MAG: oxygen-independent coproporphyrinogen III oxidase [Cyanobacteria bacterium]|nr:oxygen-independent coproporphyrinogen III oxidase [Cyanobacteriota bacterium]